mgnify:CR=1 FL=1
MLSILNWMSEHIFTTIVAAAIIYCIIMFFGLIYTVYDCTKDTMPIKQQVFEEEQSEETDKDSF